MIDVGTHNYIGTWPCGCILAVICDVPGQSKQTAKDVAELIKGGASVTRVLHSEFREMEFGHRLTCSLPKHQDRARKMQEARAERERDREAAQG